MGDKMADNIIQVLLNLKNALKSLHQAAMSKQKALVKLNYEELETAIILEEKMLLATRECEQARMKALEEFYISNHLNHESYRISELCLKFNPGSAESEIKKLRLLEKQIKSSIAEINKVNQQNIYIIQHSRTFIKDTIASLISANKSFLDKRV